MTWGIPVRTAGRAGFSARRGNEGEAIKAQKNYAAQECDARPNGPAGRATKVGYKSFAGFQKSKLRLIIVNVP